MATASKTAKLPPALRQALSALWFERRYTIDQILDHLSALARGERGSLPPELAEAPTVDPEAIPGRSALGEHLKKESKLAEKMRRSRMVAEVLAKEMGDASDDMVARANFQLLHTAVNDIFVAAAESEGAAGGPPVVIDPKSAMMLASALQKTESAKRTHIEVRAAIRAEVVAEMKSKLDAAVGSGGFDAQAAEDARRIMGFAQ